MKPILPTANKMFLAGDYRAALPLYQECLTEAAKDPTAPASMLRFCQSRIDRCFDLIDTTPYTRELSDRPSPLGISETVFYSKAFRRSHPKISVIIPHYNSGDLILDALASLSNQTFKEIETLIIDDCSTENKLDISAIRSYPEWMRIRLLSLKSNAGPSYCRNTGIKLSSGRAICFLDADDYLDTEALAARWELVNSQPTIAASYASMTYVSEDRKPLNSIILNGGQTYSFCDFSSNKFPCSALLFRRSVLELDGFDEQLVYGEDYECFSRIAQRGWTYRSAQRGTVYYRQHSNSITHKDLLKDLSSRTEIIERVHNRELQWSHVEYARNLPSAMIIQEISNRSFPIACVCALRGDTQTALRIGERIDADVVSTRPSSQAAGTIRFFLTRELFIPASAIKGFLESCKKDALLLFFDGFFSHRHRSFVTQLTADLFGKAIPNMEASLSNVFSPEVDSMRWRDFLSATHNTWRDYVLIHRAGEEMPRSALTATRDVLRKRGDLEGLFAYRLQRRGADVFVDVNSIAPADPDSVALCSLGTEMRPALLLHEIAARSLLEWVRQRIAQGLVVDEGSESAIESTLLAGVFQLRLKAVGGFKECYVMNDSKRTL